MFGVEGVLTPRSVRLEVGVELSLGFFVIVGVPPV